MAANGRREDFDLSEPPATPPTPGDILKRMLEKEPYRFEFTQAMRLLQELTPGRRPVGYIGPSSDEVARFRSRPHLGFPAGQVHELDFGPEGPRGSAQPTMTVTFLGLTGPSGALPIVYSELTIAEGPGGPLNDFLGLLDHRILSLFYRAWGRNHGFLAPDPVANERFRGLVLAAAGLTLGPTGGPHNPVVEALEPYAGLLALHRRSAVGLERLIADRLAPPDPGPSPTDRASRKKTREAAEAAAIPVEVVPFVGRWIAIDGAAVLKLGGSPGALGTHTILGSRVRDHQGKFRIRIGPLSLGRFKGLLPEHPGGAFDALVDLTRQYVGPELDFDIQLVLRAAEVPRCRPGGGTDPPRLGRTWLTGGQPRNDLSLLLPGVRIDGRRGHRATAQAGRPSPPPSR